MVDVDIKKNAFLQELIISVDEDDGDETVIRWKYVFAPDKMIQYGTAMLKNLEVIYESKDDNDEYYYSD